MPVRKNRTNKTTHRVKGGHKDKSFDFLSHSDTDTNDEKGNRPADDSVENVFRKKEELLRTERCYCRSAPSSNIHQKASGYTSVRYISHTAAISKHGHTLKEQTVYFLCQKSKNIHITTNMCRNSTYSTKESKYLSRVQIKVSK
jgi:hypothetical protein